MTTDLEALAKNVLKKDNGFTCDGWHQRTLAQGVLDLSAKNTTLGVLVEMKNKELAELQPKAILSDALLRSKDAEITRLKREVNELSVWDTVESDNCQKPYPEVEEG